jgi:uncharacterized membrane protein YidH (DUF202 family)
VRTLAAERTSLAWTRSAFAILAIAAVIARAGEQAGELVATGVAVAVLALLAALVAWAGRRIYARRTDAEPVDPRVSRGLMLLHPAAVMVSAVAAFAIALLT